MHMLFSSTLGQPLPKVAVRTGASRKSSTKLMFCRVGLQAADGVCRLRSKLVTNGAQHDDKASSHRSVRASSIGSPLLRDPVLSGDNLTYIVKVLEGEMAVKGADVSVFIDVIGMPRIRRSSPAHLSPCGAVLRTFVLQTASSCLHHPRNSAASLGRRPRTPSLGGRLGSCRLRARRMCC